MDTQEKAWFKEYAESKGYGKDEMIVAKSKLQNSAGFDIFKKLKVAGYSEEEIKSYFKEHEGELAFVELFGTWLR